MGLSGLGRRPDDTWQSFRPVSRPRQHFHAGAALRENKKYYERTYQLIENIDIPFLEDAQTNQVIQNKGDTAFIQPSC